MQNLAPSPAHLPDSRTAVPPLPRRDHPSSVRRESQRRQSHPLSRTQLAAIRAAMHVFVEDDISQGTRPEDRRYCDACERLRSAAGFVRYERYIICNLCATEYEVASARGITLSAGQYVRDKNFGEAGFYSLDSEFDD
jgi:hypothetical protein